MVEKPDPVFYPNTLDDGKSSKVVEFIDPYLQPGEEESE
jgi:hypothetical protein